MKHIFIVNPQAGAQSALHTIEAALYPYKDKIDYEIYKTTRCGDAMRYTSMRCQETLEHLRFYACGGDGTINEVANGMAEHHHVSMTCYPCGSGNDFVKVFGGKDKFLNIEKLLQAQETEIDLMKIGNRYCINICNFGFDTCVARTMAKIKRKPLIGGKNAYISSVLYAFCKAVRNWCSLKADQKELHHGDMLLCTVSNGICVGGAFYCAPRAKVDDGWMEVCLVKTMPRLKMLTLLPVYQKGKHLEDRRFQSSVVYTRAKTVEITAQEGFAISIDGEIIDTSHFIIEMVPKAIRFAVPE